MNKIIEEVLSQHKNALGKDFNTYRNHVYRVFSICLIMDNNKQNEEKYAIASAFHDLGIWTNNTFDYLEPSIALAHHYLEKTGKSDWNDEVGLMINMHHKISKYTGNYQNTVETFRRADWIEVSMGIKLFGFNRSAYKALTEEYPSLGFHRFLIIQTIKNLPKSPLNPLPMFKK